MGLLRVFVVLVLAVGSARADEPPPVPVTKVELAEHPEIAKTGKIAIYRGEADDKGVAFFVEGLGIATPAGVMLASGDAASPMRLSVKNDLSFDWDKHPKADNGVTQYRFRTEGAAMFLVQSPTAERKPYQILFWVGPEIPLHKLMASPFLSQADYDRKHPGGPGGGGGNTGVIVAAAVGGALVVLILVAVVRRRKKVTP